MDIIRSRILSRHTMATEVISLDLPINPLSHLILTMMGYNATDEATLAELLGFLNLVTIEKLGQTVVNLESEDLYALQAYLQRALPNVTGRLATDNYTRTITLIVPFGRTLFNPAECFPGTKKGELHLHVDTTVPGTSWDNALISIDAVELLAASPTNYLKSTVQHISAFGSTGAHDLEVGTGNKIVCHQLRMTTVPTTSSTTWGIDAVAVLINNVESQITSADMACLMGERALRIGAPDLSIAAQGLSPLNNIAWLDYCPRGGDEMLLDTAGKSSVKLRMTYGVDEAQILATAELVAAGAGA